MNFLLLIGIWLYQFHCASYLFMFFFHLNLNYEFVAFRAAAIPRTRGGTLIQMKLVCNQLAPLFLLFLQWMDCSCAGFLHSYLNLFHILIYKVSFIYLLAFNSRYLVLSWFFLSFVVAANVILF